MNESQILEMVLKARTASGQPFFIEETEANLMGAIAYLRGYVADSTSGEEQKIAVVWTIDGRAATPLNPEYNLVIRNYFSYGQNLQPAPPDPGDDASPPQS